MATRTTFNHLSPPPVPGGGAPGYAANLAERIKQLFDASALRLTGIGGTGNAVTASLDPVLDGGGLVDGMKFTLTWGAANTGPVTLAINGGSALPVVNAVGTGLVAGAVGAGLRSQIEYLGGSFRVLSELLISIASGADPVAIAKGEAGAQRILLPALERLVVGDTVKLRSDAEQINATTTFIGAFSFSPVQAGTVRLKFEHRRNSSGTSEVNVSRSRGGVTSILTTFSNSTGTYVAESSDVDVQPGDLITLTFRSTTGGSGDARIRLRQLCTHVDTYLWPIQGLLAVENNALIT